MKIALGLVRVLFVALLFHLNTTVLGDRYEGSFPAARSYPYGTGSASASERSEILETLELFQNGYAARDQALLDDFMGRLFSADNTTILGTMPREICVGFDQAADLVRTDWQSWGDCLFDLENVQISSSGEVAWIATVGFVRFDLSRFLVLPLRLSGILVREDGIWRFQHLQFQFDLDLSYLLLITALLGIWLVVELITLAVIAVNRLRPRDTVSDTGG